MKTQTLLLILLFTTPLVKANWTPKADFPSSARYSAIYFSIGNNGYIGMGYNSTYRNDLWEYVPSTDSWTQKADYPTFGRNAAACFTINNLGYVACGGNGVNSAQSLYAFSPLLNLWISKAAYPVNPAPQDCFGFAIGDKG
ncbi:MAG: hypothetical protein ABI772_13840, partial [Bacteroidota bacterium]